MNPNDQYSQNPQQQSNQQQSQNQQQPQQQNQSNQQQPYSQSQQGTDQQQTMQQPGMQSLQGQETLIQQRQNQQQAEQPEQTSKEEAMGKLKETIGNSHEILITATTVFPFTLFPDTVTVDRTKLTITHRTFFSVAEVMSINIEDVLNVTANVGPFFGLLKITTRFFDVNKPYEVNMFWRDDALRIKRILQGHVIAAQKKIDTSAFGTKELAKMLDELGKGSDGEQV